MNKQTTKTKQQNKRPPSRAGVRAVQTGDTINDSVVIDAFEGSVGAKRPTGLPWPPEATDPVRNAESKALVLGPEAHGLAGRVASLIITGEQEHQNAVDLGRRLLSEYDRIDAERRALVDPLNATVKRINAIFKPALTELENGKNALRSKVGAWEAEIQRKSREAEDKAHKLLEAGEEKKAQKAMSVAAALPSGHAEGSSTRAVYKGEVTDASKIPREFLVPDLAKLEAMTKLSKGDPGIPGWRGWVEHTAVFRR